MPKKRSRQATSVTLYSESDSEHDEIERYHKERDKLLLDSDQENSDSTEEEEVYGLDESDSEDEEIAQMQQQLRQIKRNKIKKKLGSDLEDDTEDEALPDSRAWGSKKSWFMGGDVRDNKIILSGSDDETGAAALEEKEMLEIEKSRLARMSEEDYLPPSLMMTFEEKQQKKKPSETKEKSKKGKQKKSSVETLKEMHPECMPLFKDFKSKMQELLQRIIPLMGLMKKGKMDELGASYIRMKYHIICNYLICGGFYMYLMAKQTPRIHHHPIMKRLLEFQQFYNRLVPLDKRVKADIDQILEYLNRGKDVGGVTCGVPGAETTSPAVSTKKKARKAQLEAGPAAKKRKVLMSFEEEDDMESKDTDEEKQPNNHNENEQERRVITYEMEKNKGLTAHKKKDLNNPRVKHRKKYRRALIRRKGQVRDYKAPKMAYSGEMTGIRSGIIRSRKLK